MIPRPVDYGHRAACRDEPSHWWFALPIERESTTSPQDVIDAKREFAMAQQVCVECPVALLCAQYAYAVEDRGLWALTEHERYYLGGRGHPGGYKKSKNRDAHMAALLSVANRFGLLHPVTAWAATLSKPAKRGRPAKVQAQQDEVA